MKFFLWNFVELLIVDQLSKVFQETLESKRVAFDLKNETCLNWMPFILKNGFHIKVLVNNRIYDFHKNNVYKMFKIY